MSRPAISSTAILLLLVCLASARPGRADDAQVLFEPKTQISAFGGPGARVAFLPGGEALLTGGMGAVNLGGGVSAGVAGYSLATEYVPQRSGLKYDIGYSYWGVDLGMDFFRHSLFNLEVSVLAGPAQGWSVAREVGAGRTYVNYFQLEPELDLVLNVTHELRIALGASWRVWSGADLNDTLSTDLGGGAVGLTLMYGSN